MTCPACGLDPCECSEVAGVPLLWRRRDDEGEVDDDRCDELRLRVRRYAAANED